MRDVVLVQVVDSLEELLHDVNGCRLRDWRLVLPLLLYPVVQIAVTHILHNDVNSSLGLHDLDDAGDLWVVNCL